MSQNMIQKDDQEESQNIFQSIKWAGGTFIGFGVVDALGHLGPTGLVVGAIGSYLSYQYGPKCYAAMMRQYDTLDPQSKATIQAAMSRFRHTSVEEIEESHAQPKDDAMRVVDVSEDEYLAPLPTPEPARLELAPIFPAYPENERLDLGSVLATGQTFAPHFNALFGKGVIASAVQGSGKSQLLGRLIEQAAKCGVPMVVCDHKGEYAPVTELTFVNGLRAGSADLRESVGDCQYFELSVGNADKFVALVMQGRYQAIIDLPSYGDSWLVRAEIVAEVGQALMRYAATQRKAGALLLPCLVALDEAQLYLPQNVNLLPPEAKKNTEILDSLNNAYFSLVSNGRSNGYTVVFATQSLTYIAKWAIKSCQIKIFGRHVEKNDLDMCGETISPKIATRADIETFAPGVGVVFGFTPTAMVVKFDLRLSRDDSETPGLERLRMPQRKSAQPVQVLPDLSTLFDEEVESVSFEELCEAVAEMAKKHFSRGEIIGLLDLDVEEFQEIEAYIRENRDAFASHISRDAHGIQRDALIERREQALWASHSSSRDFPPETISRSKPERDDNGMQNSGSIPQQPINEPVEGREVHPDNIPFLPKGDDKALNGEQILDLQYWYRKVGNVNDALAKMGITNSRYRRHAAYVLEQCGLKKRA